MPGPDRVRDVADRPMVRGDRGLIVNCLKGAELMRKHLFTSAIAILALGFVLFPATADARAGGPVRQVKMQDNCDPATFNAAIGPGTCVIHGNHPTVTFADFLAKLNPVDFGHGGLDLQACRLRSQERRFDQGCRAWRRVSTPSPR